MRKLLLAVLAAVLFTSVTACQDGSDRDDSTGKGEKRDRLDTVRGKTPNQ
jgi:hypothetical protein